MSTNGNHRKPAASPVTLAPNMMELAPEDLGIPLRQIWAAQHADKLATELDKPATGEVPYRYFRAHAWVQTHSYPARQLVSILVTQPISPAPADDARYKVMVSVTSSFDYGSMAVSQPLKLNHPRYDLLDVVAFCRLDTVDPATVEWRDITIYREILTLDAAVASVIARQARTND